MNTKSHFGTSYSVFSGGVLFEDQRKPPIYWLPICNLVFVSSDVKMTLNPEYAQVHA